MKELKVIYDAFVNNAVRLSKEKDLLQMIATEYVFKEVSQRAILQLLKAQSDLPLPFFKEEVLKNEEILIQTIKILALMEVSDTWEEFRNLNRKRKERNNPKKEQQEEPNGFDKILKGIMQVPKPKEDKKEH